MLRDSVATENISTFGIASPKAEFASLFSTALELAEGEPDPKDIEIDQLREENHRLKEAMDSKKLFEMLELIATDILVPILTTDKESRKIARDLRSLPDYLQSYLDKGMMSYFEATEELCSKIIDSKVKLLEKKKPQAVETKEVHRAKLLIEKLESLEMISVSQAIKIIHGDESVKPNHSMARRAMNRAAEISPNVVFLNGWNDGLGSVIRWKEEGVKNYVAWYT